MRSRKLIHKKCPAPGGRAGELHRDKDDTPPQLNSQADRRFLSNLRARFRRSRRRGKAELVRLYALRIAGLVGGAR